MTLGLVIGGIALAAASGLAAALHRGDPRAAQRLACLLLCAGALLGVLGAAAALAAPRPPEVNLPWNVPNGALALRLDALSAVFLFPVFAIPAAGAVYGLAYWPQASRGSRARRLQIFYGLVTAAMALLVVAANAMLFLAAWEIMALSGFFLVLTEHDRPEAQHAAFVYLAAAHFGTLCLFALFSLLARDCGSFDFARMEGLPARPAVLLLALAGFGLKAGLVPLHFWLPGAHAAAPSHVSAILSGVLLKTGVYGFLRVTGLLLPAPAGFGLAVVVLGATSAVLGVVFALAQHDLKRLLAYHSVENVGIIFIGAGLAMVGRAAGDPALVLLGLAGCLLHVVNHALFKALLFLGAGAVDHACGTRELDRLGGLARAMPRTAALFLVGAAAISGLPPLNGFVSEWLVALASLRAMSAGGAGVAYAVLAAPALALVGGLAAACFAKVHGTVFLGTARGELALRAHEPPRAMLGPMAALAAACVAIGLAPWLALPALRRAAAAWSGLGPSDLAAAADGAAASAGRITLVAAALLAVAAALTASRRRLRRPSSESETWACGFAAPTPRMQYTASSFAETLTLRFGWALFPKARVSPPRGVFPAHASFGSHVPDTVLDVALLPLSRALSWGAERAQRLHRVQVQGQALLVALTLVALLAWRFVWW